MRLNEVLRCDDTESDPRVNREACRKIGLRSMVVVPLYHNGGPVGVLKVLSTQRTREFEVFELLGEGVSAHEIARRLHISTKTVDAHRANIKKKLIIKTTSELISYAARWMEHRANME